MGIVIGGEQVLSWGQQRAFGGVVPGNRQAQYVYWREGAELYADDRRNLRTEEGRG